MACGNDDGKTGTLSHRERELMLRLLRISSQVEEALWLVSECPKCKRSDQEVDIVDIVADYVGVLPDGYILPPPAEAADGYCRDWMNCDYTGPDGITLDLNKVESLLDRMIADAKMGLRHRD